MNANPVSQTCQLPPRIAAPLPWLWCLLASFSATSLASNHCQELAPEQVQLSQQGNYQEISAWPASGQALIGGLSIVFDGERYQVSRQVNGEHWLGVLSARECGENKKRSYVVTFSQPQQHLYCYFQGDGDNAIRASCEGEDGLLEAWFQQDFDEPRY